MFRKLLIDVEDESIVRFDSDSHIVQGSAISDAIEYAKHLNKDVTLKMAGKEIHISPKSIWYKVCEEFFD